MADSTSEVNRVPETSGVTRRDFIATASAAGVVLLASGVPTKADDNKAAAKRRPRPDHVHQHHDQTEHPRPTGITSAPDGTVVTCDDKSQAYRWTLNPPPNPPTSTPIKTGGAKKASCIAGSDGKIIVGDFDSSVDIVDLSRPNDPKYNKHPKAQQDKPPEVWAVAISPNGARGLSSSNVGDIAYWDIANPKPTVIVDADGEPAAALAFVDNDRFLSGHSDGEIVLWTLAADGSATQSPVNFPFVNAASINSIVVFKKNGGFKAITGSLDGEVRLWDLGDLSSAPALPRKLVTHRDFVWRVAVSPNGTRFASAGEDGKVHVFDIDGADLAGSPFSVPGGSMGVTFVSDTRVVYTLNTIASPQVAFQDFPPVH
jgi:WD40 repeat protein